MSHISTDELEDLKTALDAEKAAVVEELADYGKVVEEDEDGEDEFEGSSLSEGEESAPEDAADNIEELQVNVPLVAELEARYRAIKSALARMQDGTYGRCEECGEEIDVERLEADAAAATCIACAA